MIYNTDFKFFDKARQAALISDFHKTHRMYSCLSGKRNWHWM